MRLFYFDLVKGNRVGFSVIRREFGFVGGMQLALRMQWRLLSQHPFSRLNRSQSPTSNEKLSQRQMAPVIALYQLLLEDGQTQEQALEFLGRLSEAVAIEFLKFNVPVMKKSELAHGSAEQKKSMIEKITDRFFNAEGEAELSGDDKFSFTVSKCHFAHYTQALGFPELGKLFCATDRLFFEQHQPDVQFNRTNTLAIQGKPCDFSFEWKN